MRLHNAATHPHAGRTHAQRCARPHAGSEDGVGHVDGGRVGLQQAVGAVAVQGQVQVLVLDVVLQRAAQQRAVEVVHHVQRRRSVLAPLPRALRSIPYTSAPSNCMRPSTSTDWPVPDADPRDARNLTFDAQIANSSAGKRFRRRQATVRPGTQMKAPSVAGHAHGGLRAPDPTACQPASAKLPLRCKPSLL